MKNFKKPNKLSPPEHLDEEAKGHWEKLVAFSESHTNEFIHSAVLALLKESGAREEVETKAREVAKKEISKYLSEASSDLLGFSDEILRMIINLSGNDGDVIADAINLRSSSKVIIDIDDIKEIRNLAVVQAVMELKEDH